MLLRLGGPCEAGVWCPTVAHILRGVRSSGWARRTGEQCGNAAVGFKPYKIIKISVTFPFQSLYYISEAETPTQPSVGLMLLSHILEYSIYSSCSRSRIVLAFLYTKPKIFSSSVFLFSLSLNLSFALVFQFLFYHRCLRRRWLPFVALFRKIFPNKEILLFLLSTVHQFQDISPFPRPVLHCILLIDPVSSTSFHSKAFEAESVFMFSVNHVYH